MESPLPIFRLHWDHEPCRIVLGIEQQLVSSSCPLSAPILMGGERVRVR